MTKVTANTHKPTIIPTERGLAIAGTRVTLYDVMDYLVTGRPINLILNWLPLTEEQLEVALTYINANRDEIEKQYQEFLQTAAEIQAYWTEKNRDRFTRLAATSPKPGQEALWEKLQAQKARHAEE
jgi:uncharacterized protein (DUF433 family)